MPDIRRHGSKSAKLQKGPRCVILQLLPVSDLINCQTLPGTPSRIKSKNRRSI